MTELSASALKIAIGIDDLFGPIPNGGGQGRVILNLIENLCALDTDSQYTLFTTRRIGALPSALANLPANFRIVQIPARKPALRFFQWHVLGRPCIERWIGPQDVIHATTPSVVPVTAGARLVLTVYDLVWWRFPSGLNKWGRFFHRTGLRAAIRRGAAIVAISDATRLDICDLIEARAIVGGLYTFRIAASDLSEISSDTAGRSSTTVIDRPYIVTVGTLEPRKNHRRLLEAFAQLPAILRAQYQLVLIGAEGWKLPAMKGLIRSLGLDGDVIWTGHLADSEMKRVVKGAAVFAYPSLYAGFGIPILEAMELGVPVLTSNVSSMPEVAGDAALLIDPYSTTSIASGLEQLLTSSQMRSELVARGNARIKEFSFRTMAAQYLALYKRLGRSE
jgi:glycosyltransferase involved in cell wall biosynthesis